MLKDTLTSLVKRPATEKYPFERQSVPARLRGMVTWDRQKCTGCGICVKDCPARALDLTVIDRKQKRFLMRYAIDRCIFCAQCVQSCPQDALSMSSEEWELAALDKAPFTVCWGDDDDVEGAVAERTAKVA